MRTLLALITIAVLSFLAFMWFNAAPVRAVAKPIPARAPKANTSDAAEVNSDSEGSADVPVLGAIKDRSGARAPHPGLVPDTESPTAQTEGERWAEALLARYVLSSPGTGRTDWAFVLISHRAGVIAAQLTGPESESLQFTGTVRSHRIETYDDVPWDIYELSFKNADKQRVEMVIECTESLVSGGGVYIGVDEDDDEDEVPRNFTIESSE